MGRGGVALAHAAVGAQRRRRAVRRCLVRTVCEALQLCAGRPDRCRNLSSPARRIRETEGGRLLEYRVLSRDQAIRVCPGGGKSRRGGSQSSPRTASPGGGEAFRRGSGKRAASQ